MAKYSIEDTTLKGIGNAVREKEGTSADIPVLELEARIKAIETSPIEIFTADAMAAVLTEANVGKAYRFTGTTDDTYTNGDIYVVEVAS